MTAFSGPNVAETGLVLSVDPANEKSYSVNLVDAPIYDASKWSNIFPAGATLTTGIDAPDGTNTAIRLSANTSRTSLLRVTYPSFTPNGTDSYTISFHVRRISGTTSSGNQLTTDFSDATPSGNYLPQLILNKWVRVSFSAVSAATLRFFIDLLSDNLNDYTLDFWGVQIERGSSATPFNPNYYVNALRDISGTGNNGTIFNSPNFSASNAGSLAFNGTNTYISIPHSDSITPTNAITVEAWASLPNWNITNDLRIISKTEGGNYHLGLNDSGYPGEIGGTIMVNGVYRPVGYNRALVSAGWHQLILSFDGRYVNFYLDSILRDTVDCGSTLTMNAVNNHLVIGAEPGAGTTVGGAYFNGNIGPCKIYNRALSANEIKNNFNALRGRYGI